MHLAADLRCLPIATTLTGGHRHDCTAFDTVMAGIRIHRSGPGRPRTRPGRLLADKAYANRGIRTHLRRRGIAATIPVKADQQAARQRKGSRGGRPPTFDAARYRQRNTAERCINKLSSSAP